MFVDIAAVDRGDLIRAVQGTAHRDPARLVDLHQVDRGIDRLLDVGSSIRAARRGNHGRQRGRDSHQRRQQATPWAHPSHRLPSSPPVRRSPPLPPWHRGAQHSRVESHQIPAKRHLSVKRRYPGHYAGPPVDEGEEADAAGSRARAAGRRPGRALPRRDDRAPRRRRGRGRRHAGLPPDRHTDRPCGAARARVLRLLLPDADRGLLGGAGLRLLRARPAQVRPLAPAAPDPQLHHRPGPPLRGARRGVPAHHDARRPAARAGERALHRWPRHAAVGARPRGAGGRDGAELPLAGPARKPAAAHRRHQGDRPDRRPPSLPRDPPRRVRPLRDEPARGPRGRVAVRPRLEAAGELARLRRLAARRTTWPRPRAPRPRPHRPGAGAHLGGDRTPEGLGRQLHEHRHRARRAADPGSGRTSSPATSPWSRSRAPCTT